MHLFLQVATKLLFFGQKSLVGQLKLVVEIFDFSFVNVYFFHYLASKTRILNVFPLNVRKYKFMRASKVLFVVRFFATDDFVGAFVLLSS